MPRARPTGSISQVAMGLGNGVAATEEGCAMLKFEGGCQSDKYSSQGALLSLP